MFRNRRSNGPPVQQQMRGESGASIAGFIGAAARVGFAPSAYQAGSRMRIVPYLIIGVFESLLLVTLRESRTGPRCASSAISAFVRAMYLHVRTRFPTSIEPTDLRRGRAVLPAGKNGPGSRMNARYARGCPHI